MKFRLRQGKEHYGVKPGELVDLTEAQQRNFADKFEPAELQVSDEPTGHIEPTAKPDAEPDADDAFDPQPFKGARSSWYTFPDGHKVQGEEAARAYLTDQGAEVAREWRQ